MKMSPYLIFVLSALFSSVTLANQPNDFYNRVSFTVSAETEAPNDQLVITLKAQEQGDSLEKLADEVNKTMKWALDIASQSDVIRAQTMHYQTQPVYTKGKQTGWQISHSVSLSSTDIEALTEMVGKLQSRLQIQSASYEVTTEKKNHLIEQLTQEALQRFTLKASSISQALQRKNYKIVQIDLNSGQPDFPRPMMSMSRSMLASEAVTPPAFEPGTQKITVFATGTIEISD